MKKIVVFCFVLLCIRAQSQEIVPITFGPVVSMNSTSLEASPGFVDQIPGAGYNIGAFARLKLLFLYGQAELSFGNKSSSVTVGMNGDNSNVTFKLNGADFSAILGMKLFGLGDMGNFRIFAGYNLNNYFDVTYSVDGSELSTENVNDNNSSFLGGIGVDLSRLTLDLKYLHGLSDISSSDQEVKTKVISLSLGFKIL